MAELTPGEIGELSIPIPDTFRGFDNYGEVEIYARNLPHWRQEGASYFVTFRMSDSIPSEIWSGMKQEAEDWKRIVKEVLDRNEGVLPEALKQEYDQFQKRFQARIEKQLDHCSGACLLKVPANRFVLAQSLKHFHLEKYELFAAVIMPNHCHVVLRPFEGQRLETIVGAWKSVAARRINQSHRREGEFWQAESFDRIIRDETHYRSVIRYLLKNPHKASLPVDHCWLWSSNAIHPLVEHPESSST